MLAPVAFWAPLTATPVDDWLRQRFGLDAGARARLSRGAVLAEQLPAQDDREVAVLGAVLVGIAPEAYMRRLRDIKTFKRSPQVEAVGVFSGRPSLTDLNGLELTADEARSLKACRAEDCDMQVTAPMLASLNPARNAGREALTMAYRRGLLELVEQYGRRGLAGLPPYVDAEKQVALSAEARALVESDRRALAALPAWRQRVLAPDAQAASSSSTSLIYWSRERVGRASVVSVTHLLMGPAPEAGPGAWMATSLQLYASHYFDASLGLTLLWPHADGSTLVYYNRSRVDTFEGLLGGMLRRMVRSRARSAVRTQMRDLQQRLRTGP